MYYSSAGKNPRKKIPEVPEVIKEE